MKVIYLFSTIKPLIVSGPSGVGKVDNNLI